METYKEKLKLENRILGLSALFLAVFFILFMLAEADLVAIPTPLTGDSHWQSRWRGLCSGASFGIMGLMFYIMYQNSKALKNDAALKKRYVKAKDERTVQIQILARSSALMAFACLSLVAALIAGYFSMAVSLTLIGCIYALAILTAGFKLYYKKKF